MLPSRRRNRSLASCEPCRKSKTRCDHRKPICASCQRRGLDSQCWYHPAPLTKQTTSQRPSLSTPTSDHVLQKVLPHDSNIHTNGEDIFDGTPKFHTWPFMPADPNESASQALTPGNHKHNIKAHNEHLATIEGIVLQLKFLLIIEKRLIEYYSFSQVALVPKALVLQLISSVRMGLLDSGYVKEGEADQITLIHPANLQEDILRSSSSEVVITSNLEPGTFCALFCGANLRIETLGLLYTMAARSSIHATDYEEDEGQADGFIREMGWYGALSLRVARELAPQTTDVMAWLAHENLQLITVFEGDASLGVWRQVGDFATDILALGLNREATYQTTPFFLAECRRRTFARAYYLDKVFAAVFNRPPRVTARHADCKLPLDLSDDVLFQSVDQIEQAKSSLNSDGWNTDGQHRAATWARIRYILAEFREEIVEYQFRSMKPTDTIKLGELSNRCYQLWNSLPSNLQYKQGYWTSNLSPALCHMHAKVYLAYLHIHFKIYRLLGTGDTNTSARPELLEISANMLETIVQMGNCRGRTLFTPRDLPGIVLSYGLPSAIILLTTLESITQDPSKISAILPTGIKISNLVRNMSVFVSQLENFSSPRETNQVFCLKAAKTISRRLNHTLENFPTHDFTLPSGSLPESSALNTTEDEVFTAIPDIDTIELEHLENFDTFDIADWAINFDIGSMNDDWTL